MSKQLAPAVAAVTARKLETVPYQTVAATYDLSFSQKDRMGVHGDAAQVRSRIRGRSR